MFGRRVEPRKTRCFATITFRQREPAYLGNGGFGEILIRKTAELNSALTKKEITFIMGELSSKKECFVNVGSLLVKNTDVLTISFYEQ